MPHCVRCKHDWLTRKEGRPVNCPACKSPRWDQPVVSVEEASKAHNAVSQAIKAGKLTRRLDCEKCGSVYRVQAHHDDYRKPLDVMWLCQRCHSDLHCSPHNHLMTTKDASRPTFLLRFFDEEQYVRLRDSADAMGISLNEFILRRIERALARAQRKNSAPAQEAR